MKIFLLFFTLLASGLCTATSIRPKTKTICAGIEYAELVLPTQCRQHVHLIYVDPTKVTATATTATDTCMGTDALGNIAEETNALVACNGGYFTDDGIPAGILKIDGTWYTDSKHCRAAIGWKHDGSIALIDRINMKWNVTIDNKKLNIDRVNQPINRGNIILYTPVFDITTPYQNHGIEIIIQDNTIIELKAGNGQTPIPENGYVILINSLKNLDLSMIQLGTKVNVSYTLEPETPDTADQWDEMDYIIGGTPLLMRNSNVIKDFLPERVLFDFIEHPHARTAIGLLPDNQWLIVVVDNRGDCCDAGMSLHELAATMKLLGCKDALNMCGGKSTTLYVEGLKVSNSFGPLSWFGLPFERLISNAIILKPQDNTKPIRN